MDVRKDRPRRGIERTCWELDNETVVNRDLRRGIELAVSYDNIREHKKSSDFGERMQ